MNIVKISDGLGNQMFQYAFARKLQIDTGRTVYLDIRYINNEDRDARKENNYYTDRNDCRQYGLDNFRIRLPVADEKHLRNWNYLHQKGKVHQGIYTMAKNGLWPFGYCDEDMNGVNTNTNLPMYYKGYFFHLKYNLLLHQANQLFWQVRIELYLDFSIIQLFAVLLPLLLYTFLSYI